MLIIGVDNGLTGGISFLFGKKEVAVIPMPTLQKKTKGGKNRNILDEAKILDVLERAIEKIPPSRRALETHAIIEEAHAMPIIRKGKPTAGVQGTTSAFNFGTSYGLLRGMLRTLGVPYTLVTPRVWQKALLPGRSKDTKKESVCFQQKDARKIHME